MNLRISTLPRTGCIVFALVALALLSTTSAQAQIYVSPKGSDNAVGTIKHPVRTLTHARDLARTKNKKVVLLADGTYRLTQPLTLSQQDSGISFVALNAAHPVISGAVKVTGWRLADAKRTLWQAPAPAALI